MPLIRRRGPNWAEAQHPGYKNKKDEARGGTRAQVARENAKEKVKGKVTRNPTTKKPLVKKGGDQAPQSRAQKKVSKKPLMKKNKK
jgi:hypothetical protein